MGALVTGVQTCALPIYFVDRGDTIARLVDLDPMLIVTQVNERDVQSLTVGAPGKARLIGGLTVEGRIRHISSVADEATRTFRVELEVPNPDRRIANGMTAEITLPHIQIGRASCRERVGQ